MDIAATKQQDENFETYTVRTVKDADKGYTMEFEGTDLVYWIPKSYNFIPKPGDTARIYGKLAGIPRKVAVRNGFVRYNETDASQIRGLDLVRVTKNKETGGEKRQRVELFYEPARKEEATATTLKETAEA